MSASAVDTLLRKAARDTGFDLDLGDEGGWARVGVSGAAGAVWLRRDEAGVSLGLPSAGLAAEAADAVGLRRGLLVREAPPGAYAVVPVGNAEGLFHALNRVRVLMSQTPKSLTERVRRRLAAISQTEITAEVTQRIGQDVFREALEEYWEGRCAVTGLGLRPLLRASHTKPWRDAADDERLDVHNGFLLAVHLDALFDKGLITFMDDGSGLISTQVAPHDRALLGLHPGDLRLRWVAAGHLPYLAHHRASLFHR